MYRVAMGNVECVQRAKRVVGETSRGRTDEGAKRPVTVRPLTFVGLWTFHFAPLGGYLAVFNQLAANQQTKPIQCVSHNKSPLRFSEFFFSFSQTVKNF